MPLYMSQVAYTSEAWATMIKNPQNRIEIVRPVIEGLGGKLLHAYLAFGEYDAVLITEFPDNVSTAALIMAAAGGGALKAMKTTVLMSVEEGLEAMRKASGAGYRPPGS